VTGLQSRTQEGRVRRAGQALVAAPVFIVGEARSGTSLLYRSLQNHSAFKPRVGINLGESHAVDLLAGIDPPEGPDNPLVQFMTDERSYAEFVDDIAHLRSRREFVRRRFPDTRQNRWVWFAAGDHLVIRRYFMMAADARGAQRLVEKTPQHLRSVPLLQVAFPRARFLYIVRHPIDTLSSYMRRFQVDPGKSDWANIDASAFCERWKTNTGTALEMARHRSSRLLVLRYEELTQQTEPTIRRVLAHVGEAFEQDCLLTRREEGKKSWRIDPNLFEPVVNETKDWRDFVSTECAQQVERELASDMASLGYPSYTEG